MVYKKIKKKKKLLKIKFGIKDVELSKIKNLINW